MLVSIVIPAFNEVHRLPRSMTKLVPFVRDLASTEIVFVDDGSTDGTGALAERYLRDLPNGRVLRLPWNAGKGAAVRAGVSAARGAAIVFMDADMASDLADLPRLLAALSDAEVALGSRRTGNNAVTRAQGRKAGSWAFNRIIRSLTSLDLGDTQCGFKAFRHAEAKLLFSLSRSTGFGFDVEILAIARSLGYRIAEVPVSWTEMDGGRFRLVRHTPPMIVDALRARRLARRVPVGRQRPMLDAPAIAGAAVAAVSARPAGPIETVALAGGRPADPGEPVAPGLERGFAPRREPNIPGVPHEVV